MTGRKKIEKRITRSSFAASPTASRQTWSKHSYFRPRRRSPQRLPGPSSHRVNRKKPMTVAVKNVIGDHHGMPVEKNYPMEIVQDKEPSELESKAPEWIRDPCVQGSVVRRRRIVCFIVESAKRGLE